MPDVSVIIVTWNSAAYIGPCLESLRTHADSRDLEIFVADNGSEDDTCEQVAADFPDVVLLRWGANLGFPKANNLAAKHAQGKYLFFLNPDTHLDNDAIVPLLAQLEADSSLGIAGPAIVSKDGTSIVVDARSFPSLRSTLFRYFGLRSLLPHHPLFGSEYLHPTKRDRPQSVECLTGAALFMEADFFRSLGGFDEQLPMYFEDMDLCGKVHRAGRECGFVPDARVTHFGGESTARSPIARFLFALENGQAPWMYFRKYRSPLATQLFTLLLAAGNLFRLALYLLAAPLAVLPHFRALLLSRTIEALTLLRWCITRKSACISEAQALFDHEPRTESAALVPEDRHGG